LAIAIALGAVAAIDSEKNTLQPRRSRKPSQPQTHEKWIELFRQPKEAMQPRFATHERNNMQPLADIGKAIWNSVPSVDTMTACINSLIGGKEIKPIYPQITHHEDHGACFMAGFELNGKCFSAKYQGAPAPEPDRPGLRRQNAHIESLKDALWDVVIMPKERASAVIVEFGYSLGGSIATDSGSVSATPGLFTNIKFNLPETFAVMYPELIIAVNNALGMGWAAFKASVVPVIQGKVAETRNGIAAKLGVSPVVIQMVDEAILKGFHGLQAVSEWFKTTAKFFSDYIKENFPTLYYIFLQFDVGFNSGNKGNDGSVKDVNEAQGESNEGNDGFVWSVMLADKGNMVCRKDDTSDCRPAPSLTVEWRAKDANEISAVCVDVVAPLKGIPPAPPAIGMGTCGWSNQGLHLQGQLGGIDYGKALFSFLMTKPLSCDEFKNKEGEGHNWKAIFENIKSKWPALVKLGGDVRDNGGNTAASGARDIVSGVVSGDAGTAVTGAVKVVAGTAQAAVTTLLPAVLTAVWTALKDAIGGAVISLSFEIRLLIMVIGTKVDLAVGPILTSLMDNFGDAAEAVAGPNPASDTCG